MKEGITMIKHLSVSSKSREELIDITSEVMKAVADSNASDGICVIYTPHTTAAITINENADPDVRRDIIRGLSHLQLEKVDFAHMEGNSPAHVKSSLVGCSETVLIEKGKLMLGTWQGIYLCEFDGPRSRKVLVKIMKDN
jgi:secondary thiamine-phosphate synthase enzyme